MVGRLERTIVAAAVLPLVIMLTGCSSLHLADTSDPMVAPPPETFGWPLEEAWSYDAGAAFGPEPLARSGRHVLVGNRRGEIHAINSATGKGAGRHEFGASVEGRSVVHGGILIVPVKSGGASVQAFNLSAGRVLWEWKEEPVESGLSLYRNQVIVAGIGGTVAALHPTTGEVRWEVRPSTAGYLASPVPWRGRLIVADTRGVLTAVDAETGLVDWQLDLGGPVQRDPAVDGDLLIVPTTRGTVHAVDLREEGIRWTYTTGADFHRLTSPVVAGSSIFFGTSSGKVHALSLDDGEPLWETDLGAAITAPPLVVGSDLIIGTMDSRLVRISARAGDVLGEQEVRGRVKSSILADGEGLLVPVEPSHVIRYRWPDQ